MSRNALLVFYGSLEVALGNTTVVMIAASNASDSNPAWALFVAIPVAIVLLGAAIVSWSFRAEDMNLAARATPRWLGLLLLLPVLVSTGYAFGSFASIFSDNSSLLWNLWAISMVSWVLGVTLEIRFQARPTASADAPSETATPTSQT